MFLIISPGNTLLGVDIKWPKIGKWEINGGYGRDDPYNRDLSFTQRSLNEMGFGNVFYRITPRLRVALELSRWRTRWVGLPTGSVFRYVNPGASSNKFAHRLYAIK